VKDTLKFPPGEVRFDTMARLERRLKSKPFFGYTLGGSSRKNTGCKRAAVEAVRKPTKERSV
jgi:hypothetical protein